MKAVPNTMGQVRRLLAETLHEVRYGHLNPQQAVAVAKVAAQIVNSLSAEIEASKFLAEMGVDKQQLGALPLNRGEQFGDVAGGEA